MQYLDDTCFQKLSEQRTDIGGYIERGQAGPDPAVWTAMYAVTNRVCFKNVPENVTQALACVPFDLRNWSSTLGLVQDAPTVEMIRNGNWTIHVPPAPPPGCDVAQVKCKGPGAVTMIRNQLARNESAACCPGYACGGTKPNWYTDPDEMECMDCNEVYVSYNRATRRYEVGAASSYSWAADAVDVCLAHGVPPSLPPPTPPPPPPSPPAEKNGIFNDPDAKCGAGCIGAVVISALVILAGFAYWYQVRINKTDEPGTQEAAAKKQQRKDDGADGDDGGDGDGGGD